jgi:hypothetical protein
MLVLVLVSLVTWGTAAMPLSASAQEAIGTRRAKAAKAHADRNFADALKIYRELISDPKNDEKAATDLAHAIQCTQQLNKVTEIDSLSDEFLPNEKAKVRLHVTDHTGENYRGSLVVAVYDKSVEYISGGSNIDDIREYFWKWRRSHYPYVSSSLIHYSQNLVPTGQPGFSFLGVFGADLRQDFAGEKYGKDEGESRPGAGREAA